MADATKQVPINGGTLISDFKNLFSLLRAKRTMAFAYGLMFAFIVFTLFLAFNPSPNSISPWFSNIFTSAKSNPSTTISSDESYRSHSSSIFSYLFPNSSQNSHNFSSPPSQNITSSSQNTTFQPPKLNQNKETQNFNNFTSLPSPNNISSSQNTTFQAPQLSKDKETQNFHNFTSVPSPNSISSSHNTTFQAPQLSKESQNKETHEEIEAFKPNQSKIEPPKSPISANETANLVPKSSSGGKNSTGYGDKIISQKGGIKNFTSTLLKKQKNGTNLGMSVKQGRENLVRNLMNCDLFDGNWVRDESYPLYKPSSCSLIDEQFNCFLNGRPDRSYLKLKWKPKGCTLPRLDGSHVLKLLRGKRLVFVGDSLNRNMWESLICILRNSVKDQTKVYEASGRHHFRAEASYSFVFKDYDCTIEFFVSPFLVREWEVSEKDGSKKETLRLDIIGNSADQYKTADIVIFNTGHWWTHDKTSKGKDYYQEGSHVYSELNVIEAFRKALTTWARWVDANINPTRTLVFFRGYSASHFSGGQWNSGGQCDHETEPIKNDTYLSQYPSKMTVLESVLKGMKTQVSYLNITRLTDYRKDGHPSIYRKQHLSEEERKSPLRFQDCSHWCLPGVPDAWNELLYAELLVKLQQQQQQKRP